jgi:ATP-dependent Clp protease ATP-binding subunit ClpC
VDDEPVSPGFSPAFRRIVVLAQQEALRVPTPLDDDYLLAGILADGESPAARTLAAQGMSLEQVRAELSRGTIRDDEPPGHVPFTTEAKDAVDRATRRSARRGDRVSAEDLLLALADGEGNATRLLDAGGVNVDDLRADR